MGITPSSDRRLVLAPFALGLVFAIVFVLVVTTATRSLQPHHLPVGLVAPAPIADRVQSGLESRAPGAFDVHRRSGEADARAAVSDGRDYGALVVRGPQAHVLVASAQGQATTAAIRTVFTGIAGAAHLGVTVEDVRPLPGADPTGMLAALLLIPLILASLLGGVGGVVAPSVPAPVRVGLLLAYAAVVGLGVTLTVRLVEGGLSADYWAVSGVTSLFVLAMAATVTWLGRVAGVAGLGLAVLTLLVRPADGRDLCAVGVPPRLLPAAVTEPPAWRRGHRPSGPALPRRRGAGATPDRAVDLGRCGARAHAGRGPGARRRLREGSGRAPTYHGATWPGCWWWRMRSASVTC